MEGILYAVGAAEASPSRGKGRKDALADGRDALADFVQLTELGKLKAEAIREHLSDRGDGAVDVYTLLGPLRASRRFKKTQDAGPWPGRSYEAQEILKDMTAQLDRRTSLTEARASAPNSHEGLDRRQPRGRAIAWA